jgi:hypothetical protein
MKLADIESGGISAAEVNYFSTIVERLWNSPGVSEMTVKPHLNSRKCLKMCWVFSNLEFTWDFVNSIRLPGKPQLNSRSISQTPAEFQVN